MKSVLLLFLRVFIIHVNLIGIPGLPNATKTLTTVKASSLVICPGYSAKLNIPLEKPKDKVVVKWTKDGKEVEENEQYNINNNKRSLQIKKATLTTAGTYVIWIMTLKGTKSFSIKVNVPDTSTYLKPAPPQVLKGKSFEIKVHLGSIGEVEWRLNGKQLDVTQKSHHFHWFRERKNTILRVTDVQHRHSGKYEVIRRELGCENSVSTIVRVVDQLTLGRGGTDADHAVRKIGRVLNKLPILKTKFGIVLVSIVCLMSLSALPCVGLIVAYYKLNKLRTLVAEDTFDQGELGEESRQSRGKRRHSPATSNGKNATGNKNPVDVSKTSISPPPSSPPPPPPPPKLAPPPPPPPKIPPPPSLQTASKGNRKSLASGLASARLTPTSRQHSQVTNNSQATSIISPQDDLFGQLSTALGQRK